MLRRSIYTPMLSVAELGPLVAIRPLTAEAYMTDPHSPGLTLHVFEQDGGWHWALTTERQHGTGTKVVAYSRDIYASQALARVNGERAEKDWKYDAG